MRVSTRTQLLPRQEQVMKRLSMRLMLAGIGMLMGGWSMYTPTQNAESQEHLQIGQLYFGKAPKSNWVTFAGRFLWSQAVSIQDRYGREVNVIVPVVPTSYRPEQPLKVFASVSASHDIVKNQQAAGRISGLVQPSGMGWSAELVLSEANVADNPLVVLHDRDPGSQRKLAHVLLTFGFLLTAGGAFPFVAPMFAGMAVAAIPESSKPVDEAVARRQNLEQQADQEVAAWMQSRGLAAEQPESQDDLAPLSDASREPADSQLETV